LLHRNGLRDLRGEERKQEKGKLFFWRARMECGGRSTGRRSSSNKSETSLPVKLICGSFKRKEKRFFKTFLP